MSVLAALSSVDGLKNGSRFIMLQGIISPLIGEKKWKLKNS
jgi:hypothetical protein